jgi:hypothetical protein
VLYFRILLHLEYFADSGGRSVSIVRLRTKATEFRLVLVAFGIKIYFQLFTVRHATISIYRVIQEELPPLMEFISEDILSKKCHINLGPILSIYRVTFVIGIFLNFYFNFNYKITSS